MVCQGMGMGTEHTELSCDEAAWYWKNGANCLSVLASLRVGRSGCLAFDSQYNSGDGLSGYGLTRQIHVYDDLLPLFVSLIGVIDRGWYRSEDLESLKKAVYAVGIEKVKALGIKCHMTRMPVVANQLLGLLGFEITESQVWIKPDQPVQKMCTGNMISSISSNPVTGTHLSARGKKVRTYTLTCPMFLRDVLTFYFPDGISAFLSPDRLTASQTARPVTAKESDSDRWTSSYRIHPGIYRPTLTLRADGQTVLIPMGFYKP